MKYATLCRIERILTRVVTGLAWLATVNLSLSVGVLLVDPCWKSLGIVGICAGGAGTCWYFATKK